MMLTSRLKQCRTARGLTIKELSVLSGVDKQTIMRLERSTIFTAHFDTMTRVAAALGLSVSSVFPDKKA